MIHCSCINDINTFIRTKRVPTVQVPLWATGGSIGEETGPPGHSNNSTETWSDPDWGQTGQRLRREIHRWTHGGIHRVAPIFSNLTERCTETFPDPGRSTGSHCFGWDGEARDVSGKPGLRWSMHSFVKFNSCPRAWIGWVIFRPKGVMRVNYDVLNCIHIFKGGRFWILDPFNTFQTKGRKKSLLHIFLLTIPIDDYRVFCKNKSICRSI